MWPHSTLGDHNCNKFEFTVYKNASTNFSAFLANWSFMSKIFSIFLCKNLIPFPRRIPPLPWGSWSEQSWIYTTWVSTFLDEWFFRRRYSKDTDNFSIILNDLPLKDVVAPNLTNLNPLYLRISCDKFNWKSAYWFWRKSQGCKNLQKTDSWGQDNGDKNSSLELSAQVSYKTESNVIWVTN